MDEVRKDNGEYAGKRGTSPGNGNGEYADKPGTSYQDWHTEPRNPGPHVDESSWREGRPGAAKVRGGRRRAVSTAFWWSYANPGTRYRVYLRTAVAVAFAAFASACVPLRSTRADLPLRVMSYNIRSGNGNLDSTAAAIRAQQPDVVALQEVDVHWAERSAFADQVSELAAKLGMVARFAPIYVLPALTPGAPPREFGVALLSRYPVVRFRNDTIARLSTQVQNPAPSPAPGLLDALLDVQGRPVRVFNTHLDYRKDPAVRAEQVHEMLGFIGDLSVPTLVFGDMNAAPDAPELQPLLAKLHDAWSGSTSAGFTYPAEAPRERIDYVLVSPQFSVTSVRVPDTQASDHRPVVAELMLRAR